LESNRKEGRTTPVYTTERWEEREHHNHEVATTVGAVVVVATQPLVALEKVVAASVGKAFHAPLEVALASWEVP